MSNSGEIVAPKLGDGLEYHCFLAFCSKDKDEAARLTKYLRDECNLKVYKVRGFRVCGMGLDNVAAGVKKSRRTIVLMSASYKESRYYDHETLCMISNNSQHQQQRIIPVCIGLTEEEMKESRLGVYNFQYINYDKNNEAHKRRIAEAVAGPDIQLSVSLPCGSVAQGLAWSYYYGYIKLILPGLVDRCKRSKWANHDTIRLIPKVFILIPDTGYCHSTITDCDPNIIKEGDMEPFFKTRAGTNRAYKNTIYRVKGSNPGEEYFAPCEYATPILTMHEMCEEGLAGLSYEEKRHQIQNFRHLLDQILSQEMCREPDEGYIFKIISFQADENGKGNVSSLIIDLIQQMGDDELDKESVTDETEQ